MNKDTVPSKPLALALLATAQFMIILDASIVNVALPSIQQALHFSPEGLSWIVNAYALMFGGFLLLGGRLAYSSLEWEEGVRAALDRLTPNAARPMHGPVPADAGVVLFADRAELLACLASDWCAGRLAEHWWWRDLLRGRGFTDADREGSKVPGVP